MNSSTSSSSSAFQLLHLKPINAAPENSRRSLVAPRRRSKHNSSMVVFNMGIDLFAELQVKQVMERQSRCFVPRNETIFHPTLLEESYASCGKFCADRSTTYYLGSLLMTEERKKAIWAVYTWAQRSDDLVDGVSTESEASAALDSWEQRIEDIFDGRPHDILDIALAHTLQRFPLDIKPFKDFIKGMRMDTWKTRYDNYEELELYCHYVAATICLMVIPITGISSPEHVNSIDTFYEASLSMGIATQLTNILRDVEEDASRGRVYLPQDELRKYGLTDEDIFSKKVTEQWREFTKMQIQRARQYYNRGELAAAQLDFSCRWPVLASLMLYEKILDKIEENDYDNLTKRAKVGTAEKLLTLPRAYANTMGWLVFRD